MDITVDANFFGTPPAGPSLIKTWPAEARRPRSVYLACVWMVMALGVLAMFEPSPSDIGITVLIVTGFFCGNLRWDQRLTLPLILLGLFVLANFVSLCYAIDLDEGARYFGITLFMLVLWMFVVGVLMKYQERGLRSLMSAVTIGGVVSSLLALLCYFDLAPFGDWLLFYDRIKGFFKDPNVFGPYLVVVAIYALHRLQMGESFGRKLLWLASCLVSTLGVLLCYSRAAWINYAVTLAVFLWLTLIANRTGNAMRRNLICLAVVLIVGVAVAYAMTIPQVSEVAAYRADIQDYDTGRFATYRTAMQLGLSNPLGVGPGQSALWVGYATHNLYLRAFSENGVIGLASLAAFILLTLVRSLTLARRASSRFQRAMFALVAAAICGAIINSMAIDSLHWRHLWLLLAIGWMPLWGKGVTRARLKYQWT